jgi:hypothetical protein
MIQPSLTAMPIAAPMAGASSCSTFNVGALAASGWIVSRLTAP